MEGLNLDNILDEEGFGIIEDITSSEEETKKNTDEEKEKNNTTDDDDDDDSSSLEGVGSEDEDEEDTFDDDDEVDSPNNDFFSSIALSLSEEGILPNLDKETIANIKTPTDLRNAINDQIKSEIGEVNTRIYMALNNGVQPDVIRENEGMISFLNNITTEMLEDESERGEELRKQLIYQDLLNRGYTAQKAEREVNKSLTSGSDIDDAKDALAGNLQFFTTNYNNILETAKLQLKQKEQIAIKLAKDFKDNIFNEKTKFFDELNPDKRIRQKIYDNISKPQWKDPNTGENLTEIQKYEREHPQEFKTALSVLFTLTDGFKSLDGLVDTRVKREVKKGFRRLESKINNSSRDSFGNLKFASNDGDNDSYIGKGLKLNI